MKKAEEREEKSNEAILTLAEQVKELSKDAVDHEEQKKKKKQPSKKIQMSREQIEKLPSEMRTALKMQQYKS